MPSQTDIDRIIAAIASGTQQVRFADGRMVTYRTVQEMQAALATIRAEIALSGASYSNSDRATFATFSRD